MGCLRKPTRSCCWNPVMRPRMFLLLLLIVSFVLLGVADGVVALQKHSLDDSGSADQAKAVQKPVAQEPEKAPALPPQTGQAHAPQQSVPPAAEKPGSQPVQPQPKAPEAHGEQPAAGGHAPDAHGGGGGHGGVQLPEISAIPGVTFVDTLIGLMEFELHGRTLGWRPNDTVVGRFTDNINNYQLGVLEAVRFTALRLKDSLTRLGDADTYDPDLEQAVNLLMNSATLWWFPSAESSYDAALDHLRRFKTKLETGKRTFYYRRDNLVALLATYKDLLGNVNRTLVMPVGFFEADDHFYYAKGVAHVYYEILKVCRVAFKNQLTTTMHGQDIMDTVLHELHVAEGIDPWIVLNSDLGGFLANHRANLNAPTSEAAHLLMVLSQL